MPKFLNSKQAQADETNDKHAQEIAERDRKIKVFGDQIARQAVRIADLETQIAELSMILREKATEIDTLRFQAEGQAVTNGERDPGV